MRFSRKTLTAIAEVLAQLSHSDFNALFYRYELQKVQAGGSRRDRALAFIRAIETEKEDNEAEKILIEVMEEHLAGRFSYTPDNVRVQALGATLNLDGFEFREERLVPTTPAPAMLGPEISALESDLADLGLSVASNHYKQATDAYTDGNWESCNSQIRPFLEDLFITACERACAKAFKDPNGALQHMRDKGVMDTEEYNILRYVWEGFQDNGPHRGVSFKQEALFRLHVATAVGRYMVHKLREAERSPA